MEKQAGGGLAVLRVFHKALSSNRRRPGIPYIFSNGIDGSPYASGQATPAVSGCSTPRNGASDGVAAKLAKFGKKAYILSTIAEATEASGASMSQEAEIEEAQMRKGRLNPQRRVPDTGRVCLKRRVMCCWIRDGNSVENSPPPKEIIPIGPECLGDMPSPVKFSPVKVESREEAVAAVKAEEKEQAKIHVPAAVKKDKVVSNLMD
eukprot:2893306-Rhodomonas_salina.1